MRAVLVVNPASTTASPRTREVLLAALEGELKLDIVETTHRSHATELGRQARLDGVELVIALGGDGDAWEALLESVSRRFGRGRPATGIEYDRLFELRLLVELIDGFSPRR